MFFAWINSKFYMLLAVLLVYLLQNYLLFCPCSSIYFIMTSTGAHLVVNKQKLLDQNISFQRYFFVCGNSFFIILELADLYAFMNLVNSVLGWALNIICMWSLSWFHCFYSYFYIPTDYVISLYLLKSNRAIHRTTYRGGRLLAR